MIPSTELLVAIKFLFPGFLVSYIVNRIKIREHHKNNMDRTISALIHSIIIYTSLKPTYILLNWTLFNLCSFSYIYNIFKYDNIIFLLYVSVLYSLVYSLLIDIKVFVSILNKLNLPQQININTWSHIWSNYRRNYIYIRFKDGTSLYGWPYIISQEPDSPYIYLVQVHKKDDKNWENIDTSGVLVEINDNVQYIELDDLSLYNKDEGD